MRINKKTIPSLNYLKAEKIGNMPFADADRDFFQDYNGASIWGDCFFRHVNAFRSRVFVVSKNFADAAGACADKLANLYVDIVKNDLSDFGVQGTIVYGDKVYMIDYETRQGDHRQRFTLFVFDTKTGAPLAFYEDDFTEYKGLFGWVSQVFSKGKDSEYVQKWVANQLGICVVVEMFKRYAQVETKTINGNKKEVINQEKVLNEMPFPVTYLDSKWFTTLIRSEGFSVRGHFRLQPKKVGGEWTKELIWINEFQKHGYTSKARILSQDHD